MSDELDILKIIANNPAISQRKISEQTGISLGQVNFLIKKFVKKGMIKIEGQTPKSIKYNLTPKGLVEKAELTLEYVKISYSAVIKLTQQIKTVINKYYQDGYKIYLYGNEDEMMEICKLALNEMNVSYEILDVGQFVSDINLRHKVFYWQPDIIGGSVKKANYINILEL